jgi:hypothetical protein
VTVSRADDLRAALESELAVVELEDELVRLKGLKRQDQARLREVKLALREARRVYREQRDGGVAEGDAAANPDTVTASAAVQEV